MIHIMMDINEHQDQRYTWGDNVGRDLYLLGVNVLVLNHHTDQMFITLVPLYLFPQGELH